MARKDVQICWWFNRKSDRKRQSKRLEVTVCGFQLSLHKHFWREKFSFFVVHGKKNTPGWATKDDKRLRLLALKCQTWISAVESPANHFDLQFKELDAENRQLKIPLTGRSLVLSCHDAFSAFSTRRNSKLHTKGDIKILSAVLGIRFLLAFHCVNLQRVSSAQQHRLAVVRASGDKLLWSQLTIDLLHRFAKRPEKRFPYSLKGLLIMPTQSWIDCAVHKYQTLVNWTRYESNRALGREQSNMCWEEKFPWVDRLLSGTICFSDLDL